MTQPQKQQFVREYLLQLGYTGIVNFNNPRKVFQFLFSNEEIRSSQIYQCQRMTHWKYHLDKLNDFGDQWGLEHPLEDELLMELTNRCLEEP